MKQFAGSLPITILPAMDLQSGTVVVRNCPGDFDALEVAEKFVCSGSEWLHLVDLDRVHGRGDNLPTIRRIVDELPRITRLFSQVPSPQKIKLQLSGGIVDETSLSAVLELKPDRVNLACAALLDLEWVAEKIRQYGAKIAVSLDVEKDRLRARGSNLEVGDLDYYLEKLKRFRCRTVVLTDNCADGNMSGVNRSLLEKVGAKLDSRIIVSGGVSSLKDLEVLRHVPGVRGVIIGRALYEGAIDLKQALQAVSRSLSAVDSAGQPWKGRQIAASAYAGDCGESPSVWRSALEKYRNNPHARDKLFIALRSTRILVPLVVKAEPAKEVASVTVEMPDGRKVMPVFTSVENAKLWNAKARLVPNSAQRVALAGLEQGVNLMVVDPKSKDEFLVRRPFLWALAKGEKWQPPWFSQAVENTCQRVLGEIAEISRYRIMPADKLDSAFAPEVVLLLRVKPGLDDTEVQGLIEEITQKLSMESDFVYGVDSVHIRVEQACEEL